MRRPILVRAISAICLFGALGGGSAGRVSAVPTFGPHPRLLLTPAKKAELLARKAANTAEWQAVKDYVDATLVDTGIMTTLTAPMGTDGAGTTFVVADGSAFPLDGQVRIELEVLSYTRVGNTFTVISRGDVLGYATVPTTHPAASEMWNHIDGQSWEGDPAHLGLMVQLGDHSFDLRARAAVNAGMVLFNEDDMRDSNDIRGGFWNVILGYDWTYDILSPHERALYAGVVQAMAENLICCAKMSAPDAGGVFVRDTQWQTNLLANASNGELRAMLAGAAATYPENSRALAEWDHAYKKVVKYVIPGLTTGPYSDGVSLEGAEYASETWAQTPTLFLIIQSATGENLWPQVDSWTLRQADFWFHTTQPGSADQPLDATITCAANSVNCTLTSGAGFHVGQQLIMAMDTMYAPPWSDYPYMYHSTTIVGLNGTAVTVRDPPPVAVTEGFVGAGGSMWNYGDNENNFNFDDGGFLNEAHESANMLLAYFATAHPTYARWLKFWMDQQLPPIVSYEAISSFLYADPAVVPLDYTRALPTGFVTTHLDATGLLLDRSAWNDAATYVAFLPGGEMFDHITSYFNTYGIKRNGVWLTKQLAGYGGTGLTLPLAFQDLGVVEYSYVGAHYHNTVSMNLHGAGGAFGVTDGPSHLTRGVVTPTYSYAQGDASLPYQSYNGYPYEDDWVTKGYPNNDARTFVRDFLYVKPDLIVFHDHLTYANATVSPTEWHAIFPAAPARVGQRFTVTYAGQKLVQDIVLPTNAAFTITHLTDDAPEMVGYRLDTKSGVSASVEDSLQVLQAMDAAVAPAPVTTLTTTNADVVEVGSSYVIGFVRGAAFVPNITYHYTGAPTHYLIGFAPSTAYHLNTSSPGIVTISQTTGSGDVITTQAGLLVLSPR